MEWQLINVERSPFRSMSRRASQYVLQAIKLIQLEFLTVV
uniref:Uncharacterized protein n=1 Tax=Arundo donax TaxID=35708 RepID=A0A0A9BBS1_ARUDO